MISNAAINISAGQTFEPEINSWNEISWFNTQFVFHPRFYLVLKTILSLISVSF